MSQHTIHFLSTTIPGSASPGPEVVCLPCSGVVSGRRSVRSIPPNSHFQFIPHFKSRSVSFSKNNTTASSSVCNATSSSSIYNRRNPNLPRQNKFTRNRNSNRNRDRNNDEKEFGYEDEFEESESLSSKNGPLLSVNQKFQSTSAPGPKEKEIVELFRKVQRQLRDRAAIKEERKVEESSHQDNRSKESETVDSLLKLLRRHSVHQGKKNTLTPGKRDSVHEERGTTASQNLEDEIQEIPPPPRAQLTRPKSNFRRRSPVPEVKLQSVYSEGFGGKQQIDLDVDEDEQNLVEGSDLSGMKLTELRALAKSRGMKGFSKLKKNELIELLSEAV